MDEVIIYDERSVAETLRFCEQLGNKDVLVVFEKHDKENEERFSTLTRMTTIKLRKGLLVKNQNEARKWGQHYTLVGVATREIIETKNVKILFHAEILEEKDRTHHRGSGMNHVHAKLIAENKKTYHYDLSLLLGARREGNNVAQLLGRMQQNKRLLDKYGAAQDVMSFANNWLGLRAKKERKLLFS